MRFQTIKQKAELERKIQEKNDTIKSLLIIIAFLLLLVGLYVFNNSIIKDVRIDTDKDTIIFLNCNIKSPLSSNTISYFCQKMGDVFSERIKR